LLRKNSIRVGPVVTTPGVAEPARWARDRARQDRCSVAHVPPAVRDPVVTSPQGPACRANAITTRRSPAARSPRTTRSRRVFWFSTATDAGVAVQKSGQCAAGAASGHRDDVEDFARRRLTGNTQHSETQPAALAAGFFSNAFFVAMRLLANRHRFRQAIDRLSE